MAHEAMKAEGMVTNDAHLFTKLAYGGWAEGWLSEWGPKYSKLTPQNLHIYIYIIFWYILPGRKISIILRSWAYFAKLRRSASCKSSTRSLLHNFLRVLFSHLRDLAGSEQGKLLHFPASTVPLRTMQSGPQTRLKLPFWYVKHKQSGSAAYVRLVRKWGNLLSCWNMLKVLQFDLSAIFPQVSALKSPQFPPASASSSKALRSDSPPVHPASPGCRHRPSRTEHQQPILYLGGLENCTAVKPKIHQKSTRSWWCSPHFQVQTHKRNIQYPLWPSFQSDRSKSQHKFSRTMHAIPTCHPPRPRSAFALQTRCPWLAGTPSFPAPERAWHDWNGYENWVPWIPLVHAAKGPSSGYDPTISWGLINLTWSTLGQQKATRALRATNAHVVLPQKLVHRLHLKAKHTSVCCVILLAPCKKWWKHGKVLGRDMFRIWAWLKMGNAS